MGSTRHVAIVVLVVAFLGIVLVNLPRNHVYEGFRVTRAKDCSCIPGYIPQKCGDSINMIGEKLNSCFGVPNDSYFCQSVERPESAERCS
jgi:hypothetical protein